jgi:hypothetical protein
MINTDAPGRAGGPSFVAPVTLVRLRVMPERVGARNVSAEEPDHAAYGC